MSIAPVLAVLNPTKFAQARKAVVAAVNGLILVAGAVLVFVDVLPPKVAAGIVMAQGLLNGFLVWLAKNAPSPETVTDVKNALMATGQVQPANPSA